MGYPGEADEIDMIDTHSGAAAIDQLDAVTDAAHVAKLVDIVRNTYVSPAVKKYCVNLANATRRSAELRLGASPRAPCTWSEPPRRGPLCRTVNTYCLTTSSGSLPRFSHTGCCPPPKLRSGDATRRRSSRTSSPECPSQRPMAGGGKPCRGPVRTDPTRPALPGRRAGGGRRRGGSRPARSAAGGNPAARLAGGEPARRLAQPSPACRRPGGEPPRTPVGTAARVHLILQNLARIPTGVLLVEDTLPLALGTRPRFVLDHVWSRFRREVSYDIHADLRGRYPIGPLTVRLTDPFGLVELRRAFTETATVIITPKVLPLPSVRLLGEWSGSGEQAPIGSQCRRRGRHRAGLSRWR